jgi:hypothetical protein
MRIKNKYIRNRVFRSKHWNCIRSKSHPYETFMPSYFNSKIHYTFEEQVKSNFEWIIQQSRALENGGHSGMFHSTSSFRRIINRERKAKERNVMARLRRGDYDVEFPKFKRDADWLYF